MSSTFTGWGRTMASVSDTARPRQVSEVIALLETNDAVIARGLGRSYGDPAQVSGGVVLDNRGFDDIGEIDDEGCVSVGAGVSFDELLRTTIPQGWFVPVTPGTRQVTIGGAVAADVHGKNHHVDGSVANHVLQMQIVTPTGVHLVSRDADPDLFWATFGAMGLTGVVTSVRLRLLAIETDQVVVDTDRFDDLESLMYEMSTGDAAYRYSVAWVDCMSTGAHMGRGVLTRAHHATRAQAPTATLEPPRPTKLVVALDAPSGLLNPATIRAFNEAWFRRSPRQRRGAIEGVSGFFHPLDGLRDWNRLYGPRGFVQYQFCVPDDEADTVVRAIRVLSAARVPSFLAVLKRFGDANDAPLSFPMPGWTLALDMPVGPASLAGVLDELDGLVLAANGRLYLAKDSRMRPDHLAAMYPRLGEFLDVKHRVDPDDRLTSDLARRLNLTGR